MPAELVPLGERHLRFAISEFVEHYHLERNHQGLDNRLITAVATPASDNADPAAPIARRERLGGLLSYYYRPVACSAPSNCCITGNCITAA